MVSQWEAEQVAVGFRRAHGKRGSVGCGIASGLKEGASRQWRTGEAGSGRTPDVAMMRAADFGIRDARAEFRQFYGPSVGCVLVERKVSARLVIVHEVASQNAAQVAVGQHEDPMEALAADRGDEALRKGVLPRA